MSAVTEDLPEGKRQRVEVAELFRRYGTVAILLVLVVGASLQSDTAGEYDVAVSFSKLRS